MVFVLLLLGLAAIAAGVLGLGAALPMKDTTFGAAALVSASIAAIGGLILLGMAIAVAELRRVLRAVMRPARNERVPERIEAGGRIHADHKSPGRQEPRLAGPQPASGSVADVIPARFDPRAEDPRKVPRDAPAESRAAGRPRKSADLAEPRFAEPPVVHQPSETGFSPVAAAPPALERESPAAKPRFSEPAPPPPDPVPPPVAEFAPDLDPAPAVQAPADVPAAPLPEPAIADMPDPVRIRDRRNGSAAPSTYTAGADPHPVRILKSGVISEVAYTLFSDGTIETNTPEGTLRFSSIDEFRRHLETGG